MKTYTFIFIIICSAFLFSGCGILDKIAEKSDKELVVEKVVEDSTVVEEVLGDEELDGNHTGTGTNSQNKHGNTSSIGDAHSTSNLAKSTTVAAVTTPGIIGDDETMPTNDNNVPLGTTLAFILSCIGILAGGSKLLKLW
ncbi:hypothetical protein KKG31_07260 [Patescibacteria group bacterium]|nr:hypothetical protein [Patescibacteria group bacterium]MBU1758876.1 hypothetical protein [Patescibacteria group bacterium]